MSTASPIVDKPNIFAKLSLASGIIALIFSFFSSLAMFSLFLAVVALIFTWLSDKKSLKELGGMSRKLARSGILLALLGCVIGIIVVALSGSSMDSEEEAIVINNSSISQDSDPVVTPPPVAVPDESPAS